MKIEIKGIGQNADMIMVSDYKGPDPKAAAHLLQKEGSDIVTIRFPELDIEINNIGNEKHARVLAEAFGGFATKYREALIKEFINKLQEAFKAKGMSAEVGGVLH